MPFNPDQYLKAKSSDGAGGFDPDAYLSQAKANEKPSEQTDAKMAALEGFGNAASMGYLPQLQALTSQLTPDPNKALDEKLKSRGFTVGQDKPTYIQERDANIKRLEQEAKEHPGAAAAGSIGGSIASGIAASAAAPINAASRIGRVLQAAKGGAIVGALSNPGDKEGEVSGLQIDERAKGAGVGAALAGAGQGLFEGVAKASKGLSNLPSALKSKAEERAFKASGAMLKDYRRAGGQGRIEELGRYMIDNGLIKPGSSVEDIAKAAETLKGQHGQAITEILGQLDEMGAAAPSHEAIAQAIEAQAKPLAGLNSAQPSHKALTGLAEDIRTLAKEPAVGVSKGEVSSLSGRGTEYLTDPETGNVMAKFREGKMVGEVGAPSVSPEMAAEKTAITPAGISASDAAGGSAPGTFQNAQKLKNFIDDRIKEAGGWKALDPSEKNLALRKAYGSVREMLEESAGKAAEKSHNKDIAERYLANKAGFRNAEELSKISKDQALRQNANRFLSPTDYLSSGTGALIGAASGDSVEDKARNALLGAGAGLVNRAGRRYGTAIVSTALDKAGKALAKTPLTEVGALTSPVLRLARAVKAPIANTVSELSAPKLERAIEQLPKVAQNEGEPSRTPAKGEERWAQQGASKLGVSGAQLERLMGSKEGKRMLIEASDLSPGSKGLMRIKAQLTQRKGK